MSAIILFVMLALSGLNAEAALPCEQLLYKGRAVAFYNDSQNSQNSQQQQLIEAARRSQLAERMASVVNTTLYIKTDVGVGFESCGTLNAFYSPQRHVIVICSEFMETVARLAVNDKEFVGKLPKEQFAR